MGGPCKASVALHLFSKLLQFLLTVDCRSTTLVRRQAFLLVNDSGSTGQRQRVYRSKTAGRINKDLASAISNGC
jgi:hypothetical protein